MTTFVEPSARPAAAVPFDPLAEAIADVEGIPAPFADAFAEVGRPARQHGRRTLRCLSAPQIACGPIRTCEASAPLPRRSRRRARAAQISQRRPRQNARGPARTARRRTCEAPPESAREPDWPQRCRGRLSTEPSTTARHLAPRADVQSWRSAPARCRRVDWQAGARARSPPASRRHSRGSACLEPLCATRSSIIGTRSLQVKQRWTLKSSGSLGHRPLPPTPPRRRCRHDWLDPSTAVFLPRSRDNVPPTRWP